MRRKFVWSRVYARGIVGGDCHHRNSGCFAIACHPGSTRGGTPHAVQQQPEKHWVGSAELSRHVQDVPDGCHARWVPDRHATLGPSWQFGILPFMEQRNIYDKIANLIRGWLDGVAPSPSRLTVPMRNRRGGQPSAGQAGPGLHAVPVEPVAGDGRPDGQHLLADVRRHRGRHGHHSSRQPTRLLYPNPNLSGIPHRRRELTRIAPVRRSPSVQTCCWRGR